MSRRCLFSGFLILVFCFSACSVSPQSQASAQDRAPVQSTHATAQVISRNVPAFASSGNPSDANDASYDTYWWSNTTNAWLAYDLSSVPQAQRKRVLVVWYNPSFNYDNTIIKTYSYNVPQDYTIDVNPAPGGGNPPTSGWLTLVTVKGNHYHSRQHLLTMAGANWLRLNVTAVDGAPENYSVRINMDVYTAGPALADDWIFYGDSITAGAMSTSTVNGVPGFAQLIQAHVPAQFPIQEDGGIAYLSSSDGARYIHTWLSLFPGKYVGLSYGTNDPGCSTPSAFFHNYVTMVRAVLNAGKIPIVPTIPWSRDPNHQRCIPFLNAQLAILYKAFPQVIKGPDLWSFFQQHQNLISNDNIHPTEAGDGAYRQLWANTMLTAVYQEA